MLIHKLKIKLKRKL